MNRAIAVAGTFLQYFPAYRKFMGSINATILFSQLEKWFERYPNGFYKFLQPCDHPDYVKGDSWVEELHFSKHELDSALDHICTRYKSKEQFDSYKGDKFQGRYYASYFSRKEGLLYFFRNHSELDKLINQVNSIARNPESGFLENRKADLQKPEKRISRKPLSGVPMIQKNTTKEYKEDNTNVLSQESSQTLAQVVNAPKSKSPKKEKSSKGFTLTPGQLKLQKELLDYQKARLSSKEAEYRFNASDGILAAKLARRGIEFDLAKEIFDHLLTNTSLTWVNWGMVEKSIPTYLARKANPLNLNGGNRNARETAQQRREREWVEAFREIDGYQTDSNESDPIPTN